MQTVDAYGNDRIGETVVGSVPRFIFAISVSLADVATGSLVFLCFLLLISLLSLMAWGGTLRDIVKAMRYLVLPLVIVFIIHIFTQSGELLFGIWFLRVTLEGLRAGIFYSAKLIVFAYAAYIIFMTIDPFELISPLERLAKMLGRRGRLLASFTLAFFLAMRFLPELSEQARMTLLAFRSKGLDLKGGLSHKAKVISLMIAPLFVSAFKRAEVAAAALNVKGYATRYTCAVLAPLKFTFGSLITVLASFIILIAGWRTG